MFTLRKVFVFIAVGMLVIAASFGGTSGCGTSGTTRGLTGTLNSSSLSGLKIKGATVAVACEEIKVCCGGYDGKVTVEKVNKDCTFKIDLPLETFCYCAIFTGDDADSNDCPDTYLASLGCSENGYGGAIPVFAGADDKTDDIDLGSSSLEGRKVVSTNNYCASIDEDNDGIANSTDDNDDGDEVLDSTDFQNAKGCVNADKLDSDGDDTPDIYEGLWGSTLSALKVKGQTDGELDDFFVDADNDDIPDFCDADFACTPDADDSDGDCIPDSFDWCSDDGDADGVPFCVDCDDGDATSTVECFADDFCALDGDGDGYGLCDDCDDYDPSSTYECFGDAFCDTDGDADGIGFCLDCDDEDATQTTQCYEDIENFCDQDNDNDDIGICADCDDFDSTSKTECYGAEACADDVDGDGVNFCNDCDDLDVTIKTTIAEGCPVAAGACETSECVNDFECQLFADDNQNDEFKTDNVQCNLTTGCCELK
ncbi:MAG: hypothetical protein HYT76_02945 [Deltaproteobacteria bacterium]|nr:hypothetical protein [Deltaproteobacteria bacterium]